MRRREEKLAAKRAEVERLLAQQQEVLEREQQLQAEKARLSSLLDEALQRSKKKDHRQEARPLTVQQLAAKESPPVQRTLSFVSPVSSPAKTTSGVLLSAGLKTAEDISESLQSVKTSLVAASAATEIPSVSSVKSVLPSSGVAGVPSTALDETRADNYSSETFETATMSHSTASVASTSSRKSRSLHAASRAEPLTHVKEVSSSESICGKHC